MTGRCEFCGRPWRSQHGRRVRVLFLCNRCAEGAQEDVGLAFGASMRWGRDDGRHNLQVWEW